jgi:hypothetical protein
MKKFIYGLFVGTSVMMMGSCMGIDNFDEPGSHFTGRIIDLTTGQNILADQGEYRVRIWEKSYSLNPAHQDIPVKQDGEFNNTKLFAGTYDVVPEGAFWPCDTIRIGIGKKAVEDFEVTPYLKLFDFKTELVGDLLELSCRLDAPVKEGLPQIMEVRPYLSLNQFCGAGNCISYYNTNDYRVNIMSTWENLPKLDDGKSRVYSIKLQVKPGYTYFVRMGAKVRDTHQKFNYTEIVKIEVPQE